MQNDFSQHEAQLRAARQLALHLRQNPADAQRAPGELAEQFGLPAAFVSNVLSGVQGNARRPEAWLPKIDFSFVIRAYQSVDRFFERLIKNPVLFVLATSAIFLLVAILLGPNASFSISGRNAARTSGTMGLDSILIALGALLVFGLHMITFFKKRMVRYALLSGLGLWIGLSFVMMTLTWVGIKDDARYQSAVSGLLLLVAFVMLFMCAIYAAIGGGAAVLGAYLEMLRHKLREDRMSRQELLEHYFELQERLDSSHGLAPQPSIFDTPVAKALLGTGPLWALLIGLVLSSLNVIVEMASGVGARPQEPGWTVYTALVLIVVMFLTYILAGFFAKNFWYAIIQSLAVGIGSIPPMIIGVQFFKITSLERALQPATILFSTLAYLVLSLFGALGGLVQRRAGKELNLAQNDPASILAEMVRIQWKLSDRRSYLCVMVVDAAKSSEMKALADPLAVEYSFREYQNLLTSLSAQVGGRVHSTAGDGAVIAFPSAQEAFTAATRIQTDVERFNREDNRLQLPFRLRIGLHMGEIVGDLDEVEFTEVIDIAAHVQAAAPVGGIAVTEEVANSLPMEEFIPLANQVDGQNVLLALNPTVDKPWQAFSS